SPSAAAAWSSRRRAARAPPPLSSAPTARPASCAGARPRRSGGISCRSPPASSRTASPATRSRSSSPTIPPATSGRSRARRTSRSASARRPTPASPRRRCAAARRGPYSWPIPSLSAADFEAAALSGPRWALAGDAAGLVDPITREGIYFAVASGQWVADALLEGSPRRYAARARELALPELTRAAQLKAGFFRAAFIGLLMRGLQQSGAIRAV